MDYKYFGISYVQSASITLPDVTILNALLMFKLITTAKSPRLVAALTFSLSACTASHASMETILIRRWTTPGIYILLQPATQQTFQDFSRFAKQAYQTAYVLRRRIVHLVVFAYFS